MSAHADDHHDDHGHDRDRDHGRDRDHRHEGHDHGHDQGHAGHHHGPATFGRAFAIGAAANGLFVVAQIACGVLAHSTALIADAIHNLGDVLGLLLAWAAAWAGQRAPSLRRTYGWGRASILAALVNAIVLLVSVGAIAVEAIRRFIEPAPVAGALVMAVAAVGIAVNAGTAWLFSRGQSDLNVRAAFLHLASDALVSVGVVVAGGVILLTGWGWIDPLASLAIAAVIVVGTWSTLTQAADLAVDAVPQHVALPDVTACLATLPGVIEVHDLHVWALSTTQTALTAHIVANSPGGDLLVIACRQLRERFRIEHATLQIESESAASACALRPAHVI